MRPSRFCLVFVIIIILDLCCIKAFPNDISTLSSKFYQFEKASTMQGLPYSNVRCIYQDDKGFIWVGTGNGLARFNGNDFLVFQSDFSNPNSLPGNTVIKLKPGHIDGVEGIWVLTTDNLAWFNLETHQFFRVSNPAENRDVLLFNNIVDLFFNDKKEVFLLTKNGIYRVDTMNLRLEDSGLPIPQGEISFSSVSVSGNQVFLGTSLGLLIVNFDENSSQLIDKFESDEIEFSPLNITVLQAIDNNRIVAGTINGLWEINLAHNSAKHLFPGRTTEWSIRSMFYDHQKNQLWIPTIGSGLFLYDIKKDELFRVGDKDKGLFNQTSAVFIDQHSNIFVGHLQSGLGWASSRATGFNQINESLGSGFSIYGIEVLPGGISLLANNLGQLQLFDPASGQLTYLLPENENSVHPLSNSVAGVGFFDDNTRKLWVGSFSKGLMVGDLVEAADKTFRYENRMIIKGEPGGVSTLRGWSVRSIARDDNDQIWVATIDGGISIFSPDGKSNVSDTAETLLRKTISRSTRHLFNPAFGWDNTMFISDPNGVHIADITTGETVNLGELASDSLTRMVLQKPAWSVYQQDQNTFWLATSTTGLVKVVLKDLRDSSVQYASGFQLESANIFHVSEGFPVNLIYRILPEGDKILWLSSEKGLIRFNTTDNTFTLYNQNNGLRQTEFYFGSAARDSLSGRLFFGGSSGLTWFHPDSISPDPSSPFPVINHAYIFGQPVKVGDTINSRFILRQAIAYSDTLVVRYHQNVLTFELLALMYSGFKGSRSAYRLDGFDYQWRFTNQSIESVTYTNLNPGSYTLRVKAINPSGVWSTTEDYIYIRILPPWWQTIWARIMMVILSVAIMLWLLHVVKIRERMQNEIKLQKVELEKEKAIALKTLELDRVKTSFFTNISHEFRTPLTLILGPLDNILQNTKSRSPVKKQLEIMHRNAIRLMNLINQLLDFQKIENDTIRLMLIKADISGFVKKILTAFEPMTHSRQVKLTFSGLTPAQDCIFDPDKVEKILFNLLSNAFKFTPVGGTIIVEIILEPSDEEGDSIVRIRIIDSGPGIPAQEKENIFRRFYRFEKRDSFHVLGSGIGLSFSRELARLHKGDIVETGIEGKGSVFEFWFPASENSYKGDKISNSQATLSDDFRKFALPEYEPTNLVSGSAKTAEHDTKQDKKTKTILLVDDNPDILGFLESFLVPDFRVIMATDGAGGLKMAQEHDPDLVISDITMPNMDGLEMTTLLKQDHQTSHIPVIMLTSRGREAHELEGLKHGADDYITKPFSQEILLMRIRNIFLLRKNWFRRAAKELDFTSPDIVITDTDKLFLDRLKKAVQENISEPNFNTETLATILGISRTLLFRKLKGLLNETGSGFILSVRMKSAAEYLERSNLNISEIAYSVGFSDPKYFARIFKKYFGRTPKDYRQGKL